MANSGNGMQFCAPPPAATFTKFISSYIHYKVWNEITYASPNFNGSTIEV